jgi:hypothetical protein
VVRPGCACGQVGWDEPISCAFSAAEDLAFAYSDHAIAVSSHAASDYTATAVQNHCSLVTKLKSRNGRLEKAPWDKGQVTNTVLN